MSDGKATVKISQNILNLPIYKFIDWIHKNRWESNIIINSLIVVFEAQIRWS